MYLTVFLVALVAAALAEQPSDPSWPLKFTQSFAEDFYYPVVGTHSTSGKFHYDFVNLRYRIGKYIFHL